MRVLVFSSLCLCLSLAWGAEAQIPTPCESPPLMEGVFQVSLKGGLFEGSGKFTYDAYGRKLRLRVGTMINGTSSAVDQLMLYNEEVYYTIDWTKFSCTKKKLDSRFNPIRVPPHAHLVGQGVVGSSSAPGMGLLANTWEGMLTPKHYFTSAFTAIGCLPINFMSNDGSGWNFFNVYNIVLGIKDPMDFFPPFFCPKTVQDEAAEPDNLFTAVTSLPRRRLAETLESTPSH